MINLCNGTTQARYMGDGPVLPGENVHTAMGENTAQALAGHMLRPGGSIENEPVDQAERDAQTVAQDTQGAGQAPASTLNHAAVAGDVRQALRPGMGA